jgi:hypothetical protein
VNEAALQPDCTATVGAVAAASMHDLACARFAARNPQCVLPSSQKGLRVTAGRAKLMATSGHLASEDPI